MKISPAIFAAAVLMLAEAGFAQSFVNLDFESTNLSGYPLFSDVPISAAMPGWSGYYSTTTATGQTSVVSYDGISIGGAIISIIDSNAMPYGFSPIQGKFSAALFGQGHSTPVSSTINQTGLVPSGTMSLQARMASGTAPVMMLGGQVINTVPLTVFPTYTLYGGDISTFAGQVATLSFTEPPPTFSSPSYLLLDSIVFSPQQVPEPSGSADFHHRSPSAQ